MSALVGIVMGSDSDWPTMAAAAHRNGLGRDQANGAAITQVIAAAEKFATTDYVAFLTQGASMPAKKRASSSGKRVGWSGVAVAAGLASTAGDAPGCAVAGIVHITAMKDRAAITRGIFMFGLGLRGASGSTECVQRWSP